MLSWLDLHAGTALWLVAAAALGLLACAAAALAQAAARRRRRMSATLCAALHPIRSLGEAVRTLRDMVEQSDGRPGREALATLHDGGLAQRLRDVRGLDVAGLPSARAIEAAYEAREAAARLMLWLERPPGADGDARLRIQMIWKTLHDSAGNLERDILALESPKGSRRDQF